MFVLRIPRFLRAHIIYEVHALTDYRLRCHLRKPFYYCVFFSVRRIDSAAIPIVRPIRSTRSAIMYFHSLAILPFALFQLASAANSTIYDVTVGANAQLVFSPNIVTAGVGDKVNFHFFPKNHSVSQSTFGAPFVLSENHTLPSDVLT